MLSSRRRKEGEGTTAAVVETRTQREIILDTLRQKFSEPEWGYDSQVPNEIINWGNIVLLRRADKEVVGLRLEIENREDGSIQKTRVKYYHPSRFAEIWITDSRYPDEDSYKGKIQNIKNIKLKERHKGKEKTLCFEGMWKGEPWAFEITREGSLFQSPISYKSYYEI